MTTFEIHAKKWYPELDLTRTKEGYSNSQTRAIYVGWMICVGAMSSVLYNTAAAFGDAGDEQP